MLKVEDKVVRNKIYCVRVSEEELEMIRYIMNEARKDLPSMIRKGIKKVYDDIISEVDDQVYSLKY